MRKVLGASIGGVWIVSLSCVTLLIGLLLAFLEGALNSVLVWYL